MADKYYAWSTRLADNVEQKGKLAIGTLQKWSEDDPTTWTDDALRIGGKALQGVGKVASLPGIKQGLSVLGAGGWVGGKVGGKIADKLKIDPRLGKWVGGTAGDLLSVGGVAKKAAQVGKTARNIGKLNRAGHGFQTLQIAKRHSIIPGQSKFANAMAFGPDDVLPTRATWKDSFKLSKKGRQLIDEKSEWILPEQVKHLRTQVKPHMVKAEQKRLSELIKSGEIKAHPPNRKFHTSADAEKFFGYDSKTLGKKYGLKYNQKGETLVGDYKIGPKVPRDIDAEIRKLSEEMLTPDDAVFKAGKDKWKEINEKLGMEAHHIIPIHVSTKVMLDFLYDAAGNAKKGGMAKWKARVAEDAKKGIFHGNDRRNIVAARGSTKEPLTAAGQRSEIYHRKGNPDWDNPGYHLLEKLVKNPNLTDVDGVPLYYQLRDMMAGQQKLKNQADKFWYEIIGKDRVGQVREFADGLLMNKKSKKKKSRKK